MKKVLDMYLQKSYINDIQKLLRRLCLYIATAFQNCEAVRPAEKCLGSFRMFWSAVFYL